MLNKNIRKDSLRTRPVYTKDTKTRRAYILKDLLRPLCLKLGVYRQEVSICKY
jgi:hypothetical protein